MNKLTFVQRLKIHEYIKSVIKKLGDNTWEYAEGVSDDSIATLFKTTRSSVTYVRQQSFGQLRNRPKGINVDLDSRITAIEEYLTSKNPNWKYG